MLGDFGAFALGVADPQVCDMFGFAYAVPCFFVPSETRKQNDILGDIKRCDVAFPAAGPASSRSKALAQPDSEKSRPGAEKYAQNSRHMASLVIQSINQLDNQRKNNLPLRADSPHMYVICVYVCCLHL